MRSHTTIGQSVSSRSGSLRAALSILLIVPFLSACGLLFVKGPAVGWERDLDVGELETMALTQPCTSSKTLVIVDGGLAGLQAVFGAAYLSLDSWLYPDKNAYAVASFLWAGVLTAGAVVGNGRANNCRQFNATLAQARRGEASSLASHEWLDELFPVPDLVANAFDPVFGSSISKTPKH